MIGSRWAGQGLTIDSRVTKGAPPRTIFDVPVPDIRSYYEQLRQFSPNTHSHEDF
jgi:hypothetical protein